MVVTVLLFARAREVLGSGRLQLDLQAGATAGDAFDALAQRAPALTAMRPYTRCAVGDQYAGWETVLQEGAELALVPPTAGG